MKTRTSKKPTKRKAPTAAQMVGRIPKWLLGFEQRVNAKLKANDDAIDRLFVRLSVILNGSKEAREDNLATLPAIRESINDVIQMMHLYQTHFDDLAPRLKSEPKQWIGIKGDIGHSAPVYCKQHLHYCTDAETKLHKFFAPGPALQELVAKADTYTDRNPPRPLWAAPRCADTRKPEGPAAPPYNWQANSAPRAAGAVLSKPFDPQKYAADALNPPFDAAQGVPCSFAHLHRAGIKCAICGTVGQVTDGGVGEWPHRSL